MARADLLVWCANEAGAENWGQIFLMEGTTTNVGVLPVSFGCDLGFRLGLATVLDHDCWDLGVSYTWYQTVGKDSARTDGQVTSSFLGNFFVGNANGAKNSGAIYSAANIRWKIAFNMFDGQLGRSFCVGDCWTLRPFVGLKGGWIDQSIDSKWEEPTDPSLLFTTATEDLKNDFWGIGPMAGFGIDWILASCGCHSFSLFNDFQLAVQYGHWSFGDRYKSDRPETISIGVSSIDGAATMMGNLIGLAWKREGECYGFSVRLGYEAQIWLGQLKLYSLNVGRLDNVLTLQGGTLDLGFSF